MSITAGSDRLWWQDALVYQVYVRSFADSDADGVGDLAGVTSHLDDLRELGVDAIWLNPCYPSPQRDHGYDVSDYFDIHHEYGDLALFDALVAEAHRCGLRVIMDIVPNHCSNEHPLFRDALAGAPGGPERARFWFRDGRPDGSGDPHGAPPNNWLAAFGGSAWTRAAPDDPQWYLATFTPHQPDFDHTNPEVDRMFADVLAFWFDRGVDGFRVDAISPVGKHPDLPDQPPTDPDLDPLLRVWQNPYTVYREEGHDVWRSWRRHVEDYMQANPGRDLMLLAEAYAVGSPDITARFANSDQFHQAFAFDLMLAPWDAQGIVTAIVDSLSAVGDGHAPVWTLNNHDVQRIVTRLGRSDADAPRGGHSLDMSTADVDLEVGLRRARALTAIAMVLPGPLYIYQGEELGLPEVLDLPDEARQDPVFEQTGGANIGRDGCRVPLPWTAERRTSFGFSPVAAGETPAPPWLPQPDDWGAHAFAVQAEQPDSTLALYGELIRLRRQLVADDPYEIDVEIVAPGIVAIRRPTVTAVLNIGGEPRALDTDHPWLQGREPVLSTAAGEMHTPSVLPPDTCVWFCRNR